MWLKALRRLLRRLDTEKDAYFTRQLYVLVYRYLEKRNRLPRGEVFKMRSLYQTGTPAEADNPTT